MSGWVLTRFTWSITHSMTVWHTETLVWPVQDSASAWQPPPVDHILPLSTLANWALTCNKHQINVGCCSVLMSHNAEQLDQTPATWALPKSVAIMQTIVVRKHVQLERLTQKDDCQHSYDWHGQASEPTDCRKPTLQKDAFLDTIQPSLLECHPATIVHLCCGAVQKAL